MRLLFFLISLFLVLPFVAADIVGDLTSLQDGVDYDSLWKIQGSPSNLLLNDYSDWFTLVVQSVDSSGCVLGVAANANIPLNALTYETVPIGSIALINGAYFGVVGVDLSPVRCNVAFNFVEIPSEGVTFAEPLFGQTTSCSDSDGGIATQQHGTVIATLSSGSSVVQTDACIDDSSVREFRCFGPTSFGYYDFTCPGGCGAGACVADFCAETDGGFAPYAAGTMTHEFGQWATPAIDGCVQYGTKVREFYCNEALFADDNPENDNVYLVSCPYGCMTSSLGGRCRYLSESLNPWSNVQLGIQRVAALIGRLFN